MRILITGGAGFIGSHLCEKLLENNHSVVCMDNLITGDIDNISHLRNENFLFIKHDVTNYIFIEGKVDIVLHLASPASPIDYIKFPIQTLKVGSLGTHKALGLAKEKNSLFLLASTSEVYGDPQIHPQAENYWGNVNPIGPRGVYDEAKRFAEAMTMAYHRYHKLNTRIIRIFNTYGPRMRMEDGRAIPTFVMQALRDEPMSIFGDGSQTRSFCFANDLVDAIIKLLSADYHYPVNLGNPNEVTIKQLAEKIKNITNSKSELVFNPLPEDDPKLRRPDISLAKDLLQWSPKTSLDDGLKLTLEYFKQKFEKGN